MRSAANEGRVDVIQSIIDSRPTKNYLEIGVQAGDTFFWLKASRKIAVDPQFRFGLADKLRWLRWNPSNFHAEFHESPSDEFFSAHDAKLRATGLDVVFVDGLHTYEQSLRDVENSLRYLREGGVVVIDDCLPPDEAGSHPVKPPGNAPWCGDVWRTILHLRQRRRDLSLFVLDCAFGLGILTREPSEAPASLAGLDIAATNYADLIRNRDDWLDLRPRGELAAFLARRGTAEALSRR